MRYVSSNCLRSGQQLASNLTMYDNRVFLRKRVVLTAPLIHRIKTIGFQGAYIDDDISRDLVVANVISEELKNQAKQEIRSLYSSLENNSNDNAMKDMKKIKTVVENMVGEILNNSSMMVNIVDLRTYDDYTYSHSLNVSILSAVMGTALGLNKKNLNELALAALVHDIGKVFIDKKIVNKPGKLTFEEFEEMKKHSERGHQYLDQYNKLSANIMHGVLDHHEKYNGEGYPNGLAGENISQFGRIICVADVYDALTSDRPYRNAMMPSDAIEYILSGYNKMFDPSIVEVFIQKVAPYPVGTCVMLSNGKTGIVTKNIEGLGLRPVIRVIEQGMPTEQIIDLKEGNDKLNITIKQIVDI